MVKILIAEDNFANQRLLSYRLRQLGYSVVISTDGLEAIECLEKESFNLVILDIGMPRMDGLAVLTYIRKKAELANLPVIMLTASALDEHQAEAMRIGANHFLQKPISSAALSQTISSLLV